MKKRLISFMLIVCLVMMMFPIFAMESSAAVGINSFQVQDRLTKLSKNYNGTFFTNVKGVYGKQCPNSKAYHKDPFTSCGYCNVMNVCKTAKVEKEYSKVTSSYLPRHATEPGDTGILGDSCFGFVSFAGYYVYGNGKNVDVSSKKIGTYKYNRSNASTFKTKLRAGDMIRFDDGHSVIYYGTTSNSKGIYVIDSNWGSARCKVTKHYVPYSYYNQITVYRGTNYTGTPKAGLTVKGQETGNKITITKVNGANKYLIYRSTSKTSGYKLIKTTTALSYTDTAAKASTTYYYKVKAANVFNKGTYYSSVSSAKSAVRPAKVESWKNVTASNVASTGKVKLNWSKNSNASKYNVYRSLNKNGTYSKIGSTTGNTFTDTSAEASYLYYYKVQAVNLSGDVLGTSNIVMRSCDLEQPVIKTIGNVASTGKNTLTWVDVKNANRYEIYRSESVTGTYTKMITFNVDMNTGKTYSYINTSAVPGKTYYYKVKAINTNNVGADSALSTAKSRTCDLARPTVTLSYTSTGTIKVSWTAVSGADAYEVYRATSENGEYKFLSTGTSLSRVNTKNMIPGTTYYYKVRAVDNDVPGANSAYSIVKSLKY